MCIADLLNGFGDALLPLLDVGGLKEPATSLLGQLLLKASVGNNFLIEEGTRCLQVRVHHMHTDRAPSLQVVHVAPLSAFPMPPQNIYPWPMQVMAHSLTPGALLDLLLPYAQHRNEKVRGKAAVVAAAAIRRMSPESIADVGVRRLLAGLGPLIIDKSPEGRSAVRQLSPALKARRLLKFGKCTQQRRRKLMGAAYPRRRSTPWMSMPTRRRIRPPRIAARTRAWCRRPQPGSGSASSASASLPGAQSTRRAAKQTLRRLDFLRQRCVMMQSPVAVHVSAIGAAPMQQYHRWLW